MLLRFLLLEFRSLVKTPVFLVLSIVFLAFGFIIGSQNNTPPNISLNSGYQIAYNTGLFTLGSVFIIMFMATAGFLRDQKFRLEAIVFSTIVPKPAYLFSKFIGVYLSSLLVFLPFFIGHALGIILSPHDPARLLPVSVTAYLIPAFYIGAVNILICTAIISAVALFTRNHLATYVSAVAIYALYFICALFLNSPIMANSVPATPGQILASSLGDPFGISAFIEQTRFWTPFEKNNNSLALKGLFLWNRILWLVLSCGVFLISYSLFRLKPRLEKSGRAPDISLQGVTHFRTVSTEKGIFAGIQAFLARVRSDFHGMLKDLPFIAMFLIWLVVVFTEMYTRIHDGGGYNESRFPESFILIELFTDPLRYFCLLPLIFYSGELVWRDRQFGIDSLVNATQVRNSSLFLSKLAVLLLIPILFILSAEIIAIGFQLVSGESAPDFSLYISVFYYHGASLYFLAVLALFLQSVLPGKFLAMAVTVIVIILSMSAGMLGISHPLLNPAALPYIEFSGMSGVSENHRLFGDQVLLLAALSLLFLTIASRSVNSDNRIAGKPGKGRRVIPALSLVAVFLAAARIFFYSNIESTYLTREDILDKQESYERYYKKYASLPVFFPDSIHTKLAIYPANRSFTVRSAQRISNRSNSPADTLFITARLPLDSIHVGNAELIHHDPAHDTYLFRFIQPVQPGEQVAMHYVLRHLPGRYENDRIVVRNGSYISQQQFEPFPGYRTSLEISDNYERTRRDLPPIDQAARDQHLEWRNSLGGPVKFSAVVSTEIDQVALTSGRLISTWKTNDRNFYRYASTVPVLPVAGYFSARYDSISGEASGIRTEQYYHPDHERNVAHIQQYIERTLDYCVAEFGDYPFDVLRLAEVPSHWRFGGFAHPGMISMVEDNLHLINYQETPGFDLVGKRTIHEVAHEWWGHILMPRPTKGAGFMVEGLAKYTEAVLLEKYMGKKALFTLGRNAGQTYFRGRTVETGQEPPLTGLDGQGYLSYGKSYQVLAGLRDLIGDDSINESLRELLQTQDGRSITINDFISEILKRTPAEYHTLVSDWFNRVIRYDLAVRDVHVTQLEQGDWEVSFTLRALRYETLPDGSEVPIRINEPVPVALLSAHPSRLESDEQIIDYRMVHVDNDAAVITLRSRSRPTHVSVDPFGTRTDSDLFDNTRTTE